MFQYLVYPQVQLRKNKMVNKKLIWILVIVVLIALGIGIYVWVSGGGSEAVTGVSGPPPLPS